MSLLGKGTEGLSIINDPFLKKKITNVNVRAFNSSYDENQWYFLGSVRFKNGATSGEQEFEGKDFDDVLIQVKRFLDSLK
jgi:hypothetical protein